MATAAQLAKTQVISREVISFGETKDGKYRAFIKTVGYTNDKIEERSEANLRVETSFYYIPSVGLSEELGIAILMSMATYAFLGADYQEVGIKIVQELISGAKKPAKKSPAKEKPAAKAEEKAAPEQAPAAKAEVKQEEEATTSARKAPVKKAVTKKPKTIAYDRTQDEHKKQFGALLNDAYPSWGEEESKLAIAQGLSKSLAGQPFLDTKGEVLQSVIEMITDAFTKPAGIDAL